MPETRETPVIVNTEPTPLNPSPKRVEGDVIGTTNETVNGKVYGTLHKPALNIEQKDEGRGTPVIVNQTPTERPTIFKKLVVDEITVKGKANLPQEQSDGYVTDDELDKKASIIVEVSDITNISKKILDGLKTGDIVVKKTGNAKHSYRVSYKGEGAGTGICLTYTDAGYSETVSYDRSGDNWVYNSTDVVDGTPNGIVNALVGKNIEVNSITGNSIIEVMSGYTFTNPTSAGTREIDYAGVVKNGNKVTFVVAGAFTTDASHPATGYYSLANFGIPAVVGAKLFPLFDNNLSFQKIPMVEDLYNSTEGTVYAQKDITNQFLYYYILSNGLATSTKYYFRIEATFLLSENMAE